MRAEQPRRRAPTPSILELILHKPPATYNERRSPGRSYHLKCLSAIVGYLHYREHESCTKQRLGEVGQRRCTEA